MGALRPVGLFVALTILLLPAAAAVDTIGNFGVRGGTTFPKGTSVTFSPLALMLSDASDVETFVLEVPHARVTYYERQDQQAWVEGPIPGARLQTGLATRSWGLTNLSLILIGNDSDGLIGLYPQSIRTQAEFLVPAEIEPRMVSSIASSYGDGRDSPTAPRYSQVVQGEHLLFDVPMALTLSGAGAIKFYGPNVLLKADENTTRFDTGREGSGETPLRTFVTKILYIEFEEATARLTSENSPVQVAATSISEASFDGEIGFRAVTGQLTTPDAVYSSRMTYDRVEGKFNSRFQPLQSGQDVLASLMLNGDLRTTSLQAAPIPQNGGGFTSPPWLALLLGGTVLATGYGTWMHLRYRSRRDPPHPAAAPVASKPPAPIARLGTLVVELTPEALQCYLACERMAERSGDFETALACIQAARRVEPRNADFAMAEAGYHELLNHSEHALACYDEAAQLATDGQAEVEAAALSLKLDRVEEALIYVERALDKTPLLLDVFEQEPEFRALQFLERYHAAAERAAQRVSGEWG